MFMQLAPNAWRNKQPVVHGGSVFPEHGLEKPAFEAVEF
jgi:hypothetical protein